MKVSSKKPSKSMKSVPSKMASPSTDRETISIRKIMNGYIVRRTCDTKSGYEESEYFTDKKPDIEVPSKKAK